MKSLPLDSDWEMIWPGTRRNAATGLVEPAADLTGLTGWLSATDGGPAIHGTLSKTMVQRSSQPAEYFAVIDGDALRAQLAIGGVITYPTVYEVFGDGVNVKYSVPRKVVAVRRP